MEGGDEGRHVLPGITNPANMLISSLIPFLSPRANMMSESSSGEEVSRSLAAALMATTRQLDETQRQLLAHTLQLTETRKVLAREKNAAETERQRAEHLSAQLCSADATIKDLKQQLARYEGKIKRTEDLFRSWWVEVFNDGADETSSQNSGPAQNTGDTSHMLCLSESRNEGGVEGTVGAMGSHPEMSKRSDPIAAMGHDARRSNADGGALQRGLVVTPGGVTSMAGVLPMRLAEGDAPAISLATSGVPITLAGQGGSAIKTRLCADNAGPSSSQGGMSSTEKYDAGGREGASSNSIKTQV